MVKGANLEQLNSCLCRLRQRYPTAIAHELLKRVEAAHLAGTPIARLFADAHKVSNAASPQISPLRPR
jgi:hypothetical protein